MDKNNYLWADIFRRSYHIEITGIIYCATSPVGEKYYGFTTLTLQQRKDGHHRHLRQDKKTIFCHALKKHGWDKFTWEIIETHSAGSKNELKSILSEREKHWIKFNKTFLIEYGYNMTHGGDGRVGDTHSEETRKILSEKLSGRVTERKGKNYLSEMIEKYGEEEGIKRYNNWIKKMSESHCKPILQFDKNNNLIKEWSSMKEANDSGFIGTNINACIKGRRKTASGFKWRYKL